MSLPPPRSAIKPSRKILVIRLSSLGDLLLSTAFLENLPPGVAVDWVVHDQFAFILEGHPRIRKLYLYRKETGLVGWIRLMRELAREAYDARVDLHVTLRSGLARMIFLLSGQPTLKVPKERLRTFFYFTLKRLTPPFLRPTPYWKRFSRLGARVTRRLSLLAPVGDVEALHPPRFPLEVDKEESASILREYQLESKRFLAVMPSSRWISKEWGSERYFRAIEKLRELRPDLASVPILVMGRPSDRASVDLLARLHDAKIPSRSALDEEEFRVSAYLLRESLLYIGSDTGLAHLAEAVGTPAVMIFGPTQPEVGFGPWRAESRAVRTSVICSPCSKDGRPCYRLGQPYECFRRIDPDEVARDLATSLVRR